MSDAAAMGFLQEYVGKAGDVLDDVFFVVKGRVEARITKPGKQVRCLRDTGAFAIDIDAAAAWVW